VLTKPSIFYHFTENAMTTNRSRIYPLIVLLILGLLISACVAPAAPQSAAPTQPAEESSAPSAPADGAIANKGLANIVYRDLPDLGGRTVAAVTSNTYLPLNFVDPLTGEAGGWEYEAVEEICRRLNCTLEWGVSSWEAMIPAVAQGQYDLGMDGITITAEREEEIDFTIPYMTSQQFMLVRANEDRFVAPEEFAADEALLVGAQTGTTGFYTAVYDILDGDEANPRVIVFDDFGATVQALLAGDVDLVLVDAASGRGYIGANPDQLKLVGDALATEDFGFIFTPGSDLVEPFNAALETMKADGFTDYLNTKWFFLTNTNGEDIYDRLPDLGGRTVAAVTSNTYLPLNLMDAQSGREGGWEYDAVIEICRRLNCTVEWGVSSWEAMIPAVAQGQYDLGMDGITITAEREEQIDFTIPYMTSQQFMLVRANEDRFVAPEEFAANEALLVGAQTGTTGFYTAVYDILDGDEANPRVIVFDDFGATVQALLAGDVDLVLVDAASGRGYIGANPDQLKIVGDALATEDFGFIFTPGSDLVEPFNAALETIKADGYTDHLNVKWFFLYDPN
jgi:polar amino acid transport system substrate-binding protein